MKIKQIWANLAVSNIERTTRFYTELGFKPNGTPNQQLASFLFGDDGFIIHFFLEDHLRTSLNGDLANLENGNEIVFSLSAASREEVGQWAEKVKKAGAEIYSQPAEIGPGYNFGFSDPDGHKFNILYWPA